MTITSIKQVMFEGAAATSDWRFPYQLIVPQVTAWDPAIDEVVLAMSPDFIMWDDYGIRSRTFPPATRENVAPWFQASSLDGSGVVTLIDPNRIDIIVPWNRMRTMGPGDVSVGVQYRNQLTGSRTLLITGRLPLYDTVL